jgi:hypothetical protein
MTIEYMQINTHRHCNYVHDKTHTVQHIQRNVSLVAAALKCVGHPQDNIPLPNRRNGQSQNVYTKLEEMDDPATAISLSLSVL